MQYVSTRHSPLRVSFTEAMLSGLAPDGGLYVPDHFPRLSLDDFSAALTYPEFAHQLLKNFLDAEYAAALQSMCERAFNFPLPLNPLDSQTWVLELFHGPTLSFKDVGARFLAECLNTLTRDRKTLMLVATSGDTGSAVASAFFNKPNLQVVVLFPKGRISERQQRQITCWDHNVLALAVEGSFDDCQRLVKMAFQDPWWQANWYLSSANSINIGRLLPQMTYYAYTSVQFFHAQGEQPGFIVPTGNLGNATAGWWAKATGFPIREIALSTNANRTIPDYLASGEFQPRASVPTLANAMDVGNPSNFERLRHLFPTFPQFKAEVQAVSVSDAEIQQTIRDVYDRYGLMVCPQSATAFFARQRLSAAPWIVVSTADPSKFERVIEPILGQTVPLPASLQQLLDRPQQVVHVPASLGAIKERVCDFFMKA